MSSSTDSLNAISSNSAIKIFEEAELLVDYLYKSCLTGDHEESWRLLYYDAVSLDRETYLVAVIDNWPQQMWLFAKMKRRQSLPSTAEKWPAMTWLEQEIAEKTQCKLRGRKDLQSLFQPHEHLPRPRASGAGVFSLPLGPVRADVTESIFFLFETVGEQIVHMQPQLFYKHRNIEQLAHGQSLTNGLLLAERISGTASASHAVAYVQAVEQALDVNLSEHTELERSLFVELERMYNHAGDLAQMASAAGMTVGQAQLARVKEEILRLNAELVGSRYLHGAIQLFRSTDIQWSQVRVNMETRLDDMKRRLHHFVQLLLRTPTFVDRLVDTGIVTKEWARGYETVGPVARACGIRTDARQDIPNMTQWGYRICTSHRAQGDAKDRFDIRVAEWDVSVTLVSNLLTRLSEMPTPPDGECSPSSAIIHREGWGIGVAEGPRGRIAHVVYTSGGSLYHYGIRSASIWNWPVFGLATANGNIQTDFPVIDASFGLSCAGVDR